MNPSILKVESSLRKVPFIHQVFSEIYGTIHVELCILFYGNGMDE